MLPKQKIKGLGKEKKAGPVRTSRASTAAIISHFDISKL